MSDAERNPLIVHCGDCGHEWVACWLPMEMGKCARLIAALHCPSCGVSAKKIFMGPKPPETTHG